VLEAIFQKAYPLALRASRVRSAAAVASGRVPVQDREDLEQEVLLRLWQALPRYDAARASLATFIERVVASKVASLLRSRRREAVYELLAGTQLSSADGIPAVEFRADLERLLASLEPSDRRLALVLTEHTPSQASRILGVARSTVYSRMQRLRAAFLSAGYGPSSCRGGKR
jgi:RNA polymerase sigma-70 factor (ECF subfamily)